MNHDRIVNPYDVLMSQVEANNQYRINAESLIMCRAISSEEQAVRYSIASSMIIMSVSLISLCIVTTMDFILPLLLLYIPVIVAWGYALHKTNKHIKRLEDEMQGYIEQNHRFEKEDRERVEHIRIKFAT